MSQLPAVPQRRQIEGPVGTSIQEIAQFIDALRKVKFIQGSEVTVTFTQSDINNAVTKRVVTGLGYPVTGFVMVGGHTGSDLIQKTIPTSESDRTTLYLQSFNVGTFTLWVY